MKKVLWISILALLLLRNDFWFWGDSQFLFGYFPITLAHQLAISVLAALVWLFAACFCWPKNLDKDDSADQPAEANA